MSHTHCRAVSGLIELLSFITQTDFFSASYQLKAEEVYDMSHRACCHTLHQDLFSASVWDVSILTWPSHFSSVISSVPYRFPNNSPGWAGRCLVSSGSDTSAINTHTELLSGTGTLWLTYPKVHFLDKAASTVSTWWASQTVNQSDVFSFVVGISFLCQLTWKWWRF